MSNTNRKSQLNSLLNLTIFDDCYNEANEKTKYIKGFLSNFNIDELKSKLISIKENSNLIETENEKL
jgi:hypothetical protein